MSNGKGEGFFRKDGRKRSYLNRWNRKDKAGNEVRVYVRLDGTIYVNLNGERVLDEPLFPSDG
jgi:hypothetical protein